MSSIFTESLQEEMEQKSSQLLEEASHMHSQQMMAARMELERAMEISKQKVHFSHIHRPACRNKTVYFDCSVQQY